MEKKSGEKKPHIKEKCWIEFIDGTDMIMPSYLNI